MAQEESLVLTTCVDGSVKLWVIADLIEACQSKLDNDIIQKELQPIAEYKGHTNQITGAYVNKFNSRVYTCSIDKSCKIWDMFSGVEIKTFTCISPIHCMAVDVLESTVYLGCMNKNVYCHPIEASKDANLPKKPKKILNAHRNEITAMALTKNEKYLIVGTNDGILYSWDLDKDDSFVTLEIHKDKGAISNIVPIQKPLCMFGLN